MLPIFIVRDQYGNVTHASHRRDMIPAGAEVKVRTVSTWAQLVHGMLQSGTRKPLFDAAWRMAVRQGAINPSYRFKAGDPIDVQTFEYARQDAFQVDAYVSQLVNDPKSRFYIYG